MKVVDNGAIIDGSTLTCDGIGDGKACGDG
jgi:hypothetical protein